LNRYRSVLSKLLPAAVSILFAMPGSAAQLTQIYDPAHDPVTLRFGAVDPAHVRIDEQWFLEKLTAALQAQSGEPLKSDGAATEELTGLRTRLDQGQSQIVFQYVHVDRNKLGDEWGQTLSLPVSYRVERDGDFIVFHLEPEQLAEFKTRKTLFLPSPKLKPINELFADFAAIMNQAHTLTLRNSFLLRGEESASSGPESCIGNFDRLLGRYGYGKDEERPFDLMRDDVFAYRAREGSLALKVAALPYRGGSKVIYQAWLPVELRADGTVKGYDVAPALRSDIRHILDDHSPLELNSELDDPHGRGKVHKR
jgi:hypothetical protein